MDKTSSKVSGSNFKVGDTVPEATLLNESGQKVTLSSFWQQKPTLFAFIRHYG